ncbi:MAG: DUF1178 family protein [Rhodobacteraceae bacterium]|jgi:hypothetical protein|nr:DUF1178 family protein [Paracoccaceae bacterium]
MIRYDLTCDQGHAFDGWFQSAHVFDSLTAAGHVLCAHCGSAAVTKALMAPAVSSSNATPRGLAAARTAQETALAALRAKVEAEADYVGTDFAAEARAIHTGTAPERPIYGEAGADEARALIADGVPVAPLPFMPTRKTN